MTDSHPSHSPEPPDPGLYLVATPIGNLGDITLRALDILRSVDEVLAEDTRHTLRLFRHHGIETPLKSYHRFNEAARSDELIGRLQAGARLALVSDAGTPAVSDPGSRLVRRCREESLPVVPVPGASSVTAAASIAGFEGEPWLFAGFLPPKPGKRRKALQRWLDTNLHCILMVSPYKLLRVLELICELAPEKRCAVFREITKVHEEHRFGRAEDLQQHFQKTAPRGEIILVLYGE